MKIALAQTKPVIGDIESNVHQHLDLINLAHAHGASLIQFPELSITGYEPAVVTQPAVIPGNAEWEVFQQVSQKLGMVLAIGAPTLSSQGIQISTLFFGIDGQPISYSKNFLHQDEEAYFTPGNESCHLQVGALSIGLAICYEIAVEEHLDKALNPRPDCFLASVAKQHKGVEDAHRRLGKVSSSYQIPVLMANCVGPGDGGICAGQSAVWNSRGELAAQLDDSAVGIILFNTTTEEAKTLIDA